MRAQNIKIACPDCDASGLYQGFAEAKGTAVVCLGCGGKGWKLFSYKPFTERKRKRGIKTIQLSQGRMLVTGVGGNGQSMTYEQFETKFPVD